MDEEVHRKHVRRVTKNNGEILIQGWLEKRGPTRQYCFKKHWCVLKSKCLAYYADQERLEKKGEIKLNASTQALTFDDPQAPGDAKAHCHEHPYGFVLDPDPAAGARRRLFYFAAANDDLRKNWLQTVHKSVRCDSILEDKGNLERRGSAFMDSEPIASTPAFRRMGSCFEDDDGAEAVATRLQAPGFRRSMSILDDDDDDVEISAVSPLNESINRDGCLRNGVHPPPSPDRADSFSNKWESSELPLRQKGSIALEHERSLTTRPTLSIDTTDSDPQPTGAKQSQSSNSSRRAVGDKSRGVLVRAVLSVGAHHIYISKGSVIDFEGDVIVNAANEAGKVGGGLDCSLMRAAGPGVDAERQAFPEVRPGVRIPVGKVRVTSAGKLKRVKYIAHAVGPNYSVARKSVEACNSLTFDRMSSSRSLQRVEALDGKLRDAYIASMEAAFERDCRSVGFALLSSGAFCADRGLENVLQIGLDTLRAVLESRASAAHPVEVDLVAYDNKELNALLAASKFESAHETRGSRLGFSAQRSSRSPSPRPSVSPRSTVVSTRSTLSPRGTLVFGRH